LEGGTKGIRRQNHMLSDLDKKEVDVESVAKQALKDENLLAALLEGILSKNDTRRYNSFKVLLLISEEHPEVLGPQWGFFVDLLRSDNTYHKSSAINIIANLASADRAGRFERIFDRYFELLDDRSVVTARYVARNAGKLARSKPHLQERITERLLDIDKTHHHQERKDLIKADVIESFEEFFEESPDKERILAFVEEQLECTSPKTRKEAKRFLKRWGN
jgi:hypothetical protein